MDLSIPLPTVMSNKPGTSQQQLLANWMESGREVQGECCDFSWRALKTDAATEIPREEWVAFKDPSPDEIVGGGMYPRCIACVEGGMPCLWEFNVLQSRMQCSNSDFSCEWCRSNKQECLFVWGVEHSMNKIRDAMDRLVRHSGSQLRKIDRRAIDQEAARKEVEKEISELSKK